MSTHTAKALIWLGAFLLCGTLVSVAAPPLAKVWQCYRLADSADREVGTVIGKHESVGLVLSFGDDFASTDACTAETPPAVFEAAQVGDTFDVVRKPGRPDQCYLESSLALSGAILAGVSGLTLVAILLILGLALVAHRSFAGPPLLTSSFSMHEMGSMTCPVCAVAMDTGYIVPFGGIHWRVSDQPIGLPTALGGLPGTVGWKGRPCLQAFRCRKCDIVTFKHLHEGEQASPATDSATLQRSS
jgi:hypothetical protein